MYLHTLLSSLPSWDIFIPFSKIKTAVGTIFLTSTTKDIPSLALLTNTRIAIITAIEVPMLKDLTWGIFFTWFSTTRSTGISILSTQTISICLNFFWKVAVVVFFHTFFQPGKCIFLGVIRIRIRTFFHQKELWHNKNKQILVDH